MRAASPGDLEALVETREALFDALGQGAADAEGREAFRAACRREFASLLAGGRASAWLAFADEGGVIGSAVLLEYPRLPTPRNLREREGYVLGVWVAPAARRRGLARRLVELAIAESERRGHARIRLHATAEGRGVYERLGFRGRADEMERPG